ncbi:MAG TPA: T9SS type A sorting domain-containing protein [Bacteroidales bacterium]
MKPILHKMILILFLVVLSTSGFSQTWTKTYGTLNEDEGNAVQQTFDGGYIITGSTFPTNPWDSDLYLIRTNSSGDTLWTKTYGGPGNEIGVDVKQTTDNGFIISGYYSTLGAGGFDVWLLKTDSNGDTLWTNTFGGANNDFGNSVFQTDDGGYVIIGSTESYGAGSSDFWILKTDATGDSLWSTTYGDFYNEIAFEAQATSDGGYVIAGYKQIQGFTNADVWLLKIYSNGEIDWSQTYGGDYNELAYSVHETADAGYILSGYTMSFGSGAQDVYLIKTDMYGDTMWTKTFGGTSNDAGNSVIETAEGDFIVCGNTSSFSEDGDMDLWLIKTDISGYTLWTKTYGGTGAELGYSVIEAFDGRLTVCGFTSSYGAGNKDVWLLHVDADGQVGLDENIYPTSSGFELKQNYPNPFNGSATIEYSIPTSGIVSLKIYDLTGRLINTLVNEQTSAGKHFIQISSNGLEAGIYYYRLQSGNFDSTKKFILNK